MATITPRARLNQFLIAYRCIRFNSYSNSRAKEFEDERVRLMKAWDRRKPWDRRFPVNEKDVLPSVEGGSEEMHKLLPEQLVAPIGIIDKQTEKFIHIPEMVPEFVVPDLTDFPLKPYVTYTAKEITQNELSPKDVFNSVYASDIEDAVKAGKIKVQNGKVHLEDGRILDCETGEQIT